MSKIEVDAIDKQSGSTLTIGGSGTTVQLGTGASQTGFGRTGTVDWQTTKKTTDFTAVSGEGYFVDTGSGVVTVTLPASPAAGNIVYVKDYDGNFATNKCTIARNGSNIRGATNNIDLNKNNSGVVCIYVDATEGWQLFFDGSNSDAQATFITATGGTVTCSGNFKIHTFTGPGTFCVSQAGDAGVNDTVDYLVVAGGGSGPATGGGDGVAGGGGAGGFRFFASPSNNPQSGPGSPLNAPAGITVSAQGYPITVGGGGDAGTAPGTGNSGSDSVFSTITSAGGGKGGRGDPSKNAANGGSGGGGANNAGAAGTGNTPSVSPAQGKNGGAGGPAAGGGGGGAIAAGAAASSNGGNGGAGGGITGFGSSNGQCSSCVQYFSGGGGGGNGNANFPSPGVVGTGGLGGGANGTNPSNTALSNGTANTGGGGGGASDKNPGGGSGGNGGSGIVVIRYKYQ